MPGTYAPPAVELPNTSATVGTPFADSSVSSWKVRPPGTNRSACVGRSAPPDSPRVVNRKPVDPRDLQRAQALAQRVRVRRAAADGRVVGADHALDAGDHTDAGHHAGP